jgi:hypothetical protein
VNPVAIEGVEVGESRIEALVRVAPAGMRTTAADGLKARALDLLPGLARHTCENDAGRPFSAELGDTETAHLLEHVACELMALAGSPRSLRAETSWDFAKDGPGAFRIRMEYDDDLVALGALRQASEMVGWLFGGGARPDVAAIAADLAELRRV